MACLSSIKQVETEGLLSAGNSSLQVVGMVTAGLQIGQLREEVGFLVVSKLTTNVILGTAFIEKHIEKISSKNGLSTLSDSSRVKFVNES